MPEVGLTLSAAQEIVNNYIGAINQAFEKDYKEQVIKHLEDVLTQIESHLFAMFDRIGIYGNSIEACELQLSNKLKEAQEATSNLNGQNLRNTFLNKFQKANPFEVDLGARYKNLLMWLNNGQAITGSKGQLLQNVNWEKVSIEAGKLLRETIPGKVTVSLDGKHTGMVRTHGYPIFNFSPFWEGLSANAQEKFQDWFKNDKDPVLKKFEAFEQQVTMTNQNYIMNIQFKQFDYQSFMKMSPKDKAMFLASRPQVKQYVNRCVRESILEGCPNANQQVLKDCINHVIRQKDTVFFLGPDSTNFTGILGEIQGLYMFRVLFGNKTKTNWIGGLDNPHADLVLQKGMKEMYGIQVKNSSKNALETDSYNILFKDLNASTAKGSRSIGGGKINFQFTDESTNFLQGFDLLSQQPGLIDAIYSAIATYTFNIPYKWLDGRATRVESNEEFDGLRKVIVDYNEKVQNIVSVASAAMMYMQVDFNYTSNTQDIFNSLYLVAGGLILTSFSILKQIIKDLENRAAGELRHFKVNMTSPEEGGKTIVDVLNNSRKNRHPNKKGKGGSINIVSFNLHSSYNFS